MIDVTGFLGAGKTRVVAALQDAGIAAQELDGRVAPDGLVPALAVVDAVNLTTQLDTPEIAPLVRAQIRAAGQIVISRGDIVDPAPARAAVQSITSAPIGDAPALPDADAAPIFDTMDMTGQFAVWTYDGPAQLLADRLDDMLARRPAGIYRMAGTVLTDKGPVEIQIAGRVRQTTRAPEATATRLRALGLKTEFRKTAMDLLFGEEVTAASYAAGRFGHR